MKKINFKEFKMYVDFRKKHLVRRDIREAMANMLYTSANGAAAASLSMKIINSDGEIEMSDFEITALLDIANSNCSQNIIDGINEALKDTEEINHDSN